jgi:transcriptional regulator with XRE-family HTH domain
MGFAYSETAEHVRTTLGAILRRHREVRERSLADVAGPAGISIAFLSEVERGRKEISTAKLLAVARALDMTVAGLYLELANELGARGSLPAAWEENPRAHLQAACQNLDAEALRTVARFSSFLAMSERPRRRIGFVEPS